MRACVPGVRTQVLEACCAERGACPQLRAALAGQPSALCMLPPNACDKQGRLTHLSLVSEGLQCLLPPALAQLASLRRLDLTFNKVQGRCGWLPAPASAPPCMHSQQPRTLTSPAGA